MSVQEIAAQKALDHLALTPFDSGAWLPTLQAMAKATGSRVTQLLAWDGARNAPFNVYSEAFDDREWLAAGGADPIRNPYIAASRRMRSGDDFTDWEIVSSVERRRHPLIGDVYDRYDIPHLCAFKLLGDNHANWFVVSLRSFHQGPIDVADRKIFRRLCCEAIVAAKRTLALKNEGALLLSGAFNALSISAFVCNAFGRVVAVSEKAEGLLRRADIVWVENGRLCTPTASASDSLNRAIHRAVQYQYQVHSAPHAKGYISILDASGQVSAMAQAIPLPRDRCDIGFGAAALVVVNERPPRTFASIAQSFGVTNAELQVGTSLLVGLNLNEIARKRNVSLETVRSQSKAIYSKLGVTGQTDLIRRFGGNSPAEPAMIEALKV